MCLAAANLENMGIFYVRDETNRIQTKNNTHTLTTLHVTQADINEDVYLWENLASKLLHVNVGDVAQRRGRGTFEPHFSTVAFVLGEKQI